jgi:XTP/dITP diphosphohydrolase
VDADDKANLNKLIEALKSKGVESSPAHYTAAMAIVSKHGVQTAHGWMYGEVITTPRGENGFGYDPIFIPDRYTKTLGELDGEVKKRISHRARALKLATILLKSIKL